MSFKFFTLKEKTLDHNITIAGSDEQEATKWCEENCKHEWAFEKAYNYDHTGHKRIVRASFADKFESLTFKMIWGI